MESTPEIPPNDGESTPSALDRFEAIGESPAFLDFQERLRCVAPVNRPVLLLGERGTGKEMAAHRLHFLSKRWGQPFVTLHCAALAPSLIESELFGHEAGAFTGARRRRIGRFEAAHEGTLFLDEISLIPIEAQEKILRVVEYGSFERVGGTRSVQVDVRLIGATNIDLSEESAQGRFKRDLLDRLSFEVLFLPSLRDRGEDIVLLANYFASRMAFELGRTEIPEFAEPVVEKLMKSSWPGNIRELKNVVERAVYRSETSLIRDLRIDPFQSPYSTAPDSGQSATTSKLGQSAAASVATPSAKQASQNLQNLDDLSLPEALRTIEVHSLRRALKRSRYNQRVAAESLGLTYNQFRRLYRKYAEEFKADEK